MKVKLGFTLIELMVVVIVISILAGLAISGYSKQVRKSRRAEAKQVLVDSGLREEKYRSNHTSYTNTATVLFGGTPTAATYYDFAITTPTGNCNLTVVTAAAIANSFVVTATAKGDQLKDTGCTSITLENRCGQVTKAPISCW